MPGRRHLTPWFVVGVIGLVANACGSSTEACTTSPPVSFERSEIGTGNGLFKLDGDGFEHVLLVRPEEPLNPDRVNDPANVGAIVQMGFLMEDVGVEAIGESGAYVVLGFSSADDRDRASCALASEESTWRLTEIALGQ